MRHPQSETDQKNLITPLRGGTIFRFEIVLYTWAIVETSDLQGEQTKSNWYTHQEPGQILQRPVRIIRDNHGSETAVGTDGREPTRAIKKQNTIRARNQEERVGLILTWRNVSSVVFQLKFLYCQKPRRRQEHNGSSNMKGE